MKQFFKFTFASAFGFILGGILLIIILSGILAGLAGSAENMFGDKKKVKVEENSILHITLNRPIVDNASGNPFENLSFNGSGFEDNSKMGLNSILKSLEKAADDDRIKGIYLDLGMVQASYSTLEEIRIALDKFKESGKFVVAYSDLFIENNYYLASAADEVYLFPEGNFMIDGLQTNLMFFKGALEKLGIQAQIIRGRNNKFKSAVEPFMYDKMSDANREQVNKFLGSIWNNVKENITSNRDITAADIDALADSLLVSDGDEALRYNLIDGMKYSDEMTALLMEKVEVDDEDDLELLAFSKYFKEANKSNDKSEEEESEKPWEINDKIAVIYAAGNIVTGKSNDGTMGSETVAEQIKEARQDSSIKAIVLRINSGGGSALASDIMWRETVLAKEAKPLIVSMGGMAASGGYYMACAADKIYANANTITGSIGVFGILPNMKEMFNDKLGITFDGVNTNTYSDFGNVSRPLSNYEYLRIQQGVEKVYETFLTHVAEGRGMTKDQVDAIGQGRVWTGADAKELGLVDEIGTLTDAMDYAIEQTGLEEGKFKVKTYPEKQDPFKQIMKEFSGDASAFVAEKVLGDNYKIYKEIEMVKDMKGIYTMMPFRMEVE